MISTWSMWIFNIFKLTKIKGSEKFCFLITLVTFPVLSQQLMATIYDSVDTEYSYDHRVLMDYTAPHDEILI